jgi:type I restriction enzyme M protein
MVPVNYFDGFGSHGRSDMLGRYYTRTDIGYLLIDQMTGFTPSRLLDLGAGGGSLSSAAVTRWLNIEILTVDIDRRSSTYLSKLFDGSCGIRHNHIRADALSHRLPELLFSKFGQIDAGVCNPPFIIPKWRKKFAQILEDAGFSSCMPVLSDVDAALLFLAQNLRLLSEKATLGIILPDSLISSTKYRQFRKELLQRYTVRKAIRLPRYSFSGTDALAYIVVISKSGPTTKAIPLQKLTNENSLGSQLHVEVTEAVDRLDFDYHSQRLLFSETHSVHVSLGSIAEEVKRGSLSSAEARVFRESVFHTCDMTPSRIGKWCDLSQFSRKRSEADLPVRAGRGDILVARVGRNLEQKVIGVYGGFPLLTDCVYRIKVPKSYRRRVLDQLSSSSGKAWLDSRAYGVGAKQLTKTDLLEFPLFL